jgi:hypothetical protein
VTLTLSTPVKILALVMVIAAVGGVASMSMMGKSGSDVPPAGERHGSAEGQRVATPKTTAPAKAHNTAKPTKHATKPVSKPATTPAVKHVAKPKPKVKAKPVQRGNLVYETLPQPLQWELSQHKVVVVSLYNPNADVDAIAVAEAHAGAVDAGVGFLLVNVLDNKVAGILTGLLPGGGLLPDPGILVYTAPGNIALRLDGFQDRTSVAQAATNASLGDSDPTQVSGGMPSAAAPAATTATAAPATTPVTMTP